MRALLALTLLAAMVPKGTMAQPTELHHCLTGDPLGTSCSDVASGTLVNLFCDPRGVRVWETYLGRVAWPPLRYVGPIRIRLDTQRSLTTRFPLYFEFIEVDEHPPGTGYCDGPGRVLFYTYGALSCATSWEEFGPYDLSVWLDPGEEYVVRAVFFGDPDIQFESPYMNCIEVIANTSDVGEAPPASWSVVKSLYR